NPSPVVPRSHIVDFIESVVAIYAGPEAAGNRIERQAEAVANAVREHLLNVRSRLAAELGTRRVERIIRGSRAIAVQPDDDSGEVRVIGIGSADLIVGDGRAKSGCRRTRGQVLQLSTPAVVADDDVELAIGTETDHAAVVIAAWRLRRIALAGRSRRAVIL